MSVVIDLPLIDLAEFACSVSVYRVSGGRLLSARSIPCLVCYNKRLWKNCASYECNNESPRRLDRVTFGDEQLLREVRIKEENQTAKKGNAFENEKQRRSYQRATMVA